MNSPNLPSHNFQPVFQWVFAIVFAAGMVSLLFLAYVGANTLLGVCVHGK